MSLAYSCKTYLGVQGHSLFDTFFSGTEEGSREWDFE